MIHGEIVRHTINIIQYLRVRKKLLDKLFTFLSPFQHSLTRSVVHLHDDRGKQREQNDTR